MLRDARELETGAVLECDLCIVGAGPAGIALALALAESGLRVGLLESGGLEYENPAQDLYTGASIGLPYFPLDSARLRFFGGTSNHWTGRCVPLDPIDFERRAWIPYSGWPIAYADLELYYPPAQEVCQLGPFEYARHFWYTAGEEELALDPKRLRHRFWQERALRFGEAYHARLEAAPQIEVWLHANLTNIAANAAVSAVERIELATLTGRRFSCRAKDYVLACGGIENARLLLASNRQVPAGLGNGHDLVGRFFMEHPLLLAGRAMVLDPKIFSNFYWVQEPGPGEVAFLDFLRIAPEEIEKRQILNAAWRFYDDQNPEDDLVSGYAGVRRIAQALRAGRLPDNLIRDLTQLITDADDAIGGLLHGFGLIDYEHVPAVCFVRTIGEQAPNPDSRVLLGEERDALGMPTTTLDWRLSELDWRSLREANRLLAEEFGRAGIGRVQFDEWLQGEAEGLPAEFAGSYHHIGTTRMSNDPRQGVVDADCKVHGLANLYVAGSSVFPTSGWASPTLTIVALALRLADHLRARPGS